MGGRAPHPSDTSQCLALGCHGVTSLTSAFVLCEDIQR